jgi:hypothetical protein
MKRALALLALVAVLATAGTVALVWQLSKREHNPFPEISVYSHGKTLRLGPYFYCSVRDLDDCENPETTGELAVDSRNPVQLAVDPAIAQAPWWLAVPTRATQVPWCRSSGRAPPPRSPSRPSMRCTAS